MNGERLENFKDLTNVEVAAIGDDRTPQNPSKIQVALTVLDGEDSIGPSVLAFEHSTLE